MRRCIALGGKGGGHFALISIYAVQWKTESEYEGESFDRNFKWGGEGRIYRSYTHRDELPAADIDDRLGILGQEGLELSDILSRPHLRRRDLPAAVGHGHYVGTSIRLRWWRLLPLLLSTYFWSFSRKAKKVHGQKAI